MTTFRISLSTSTPLLLLASACSPAPYIDGLIVDSHIVEKSSSTSFRIVEGIEPSVSVSVLGEGDNCDLAQESAGSEEVVRTTRTDLRMEVVGNTVLGHPLVPGSDAFDGVGVSIVNFTSTATSEYDASTQEYNFDTEQLGETVVSRGLGTQTSSWLAGIAADEYLVQLESLGDLWEDLEGGYVDLDVTLLTRNHPMPGDIWSSKVGEYLYTYVGTEEVEVAGLARVAERVDVSVVTSFDPTAANLLASCVDEDAWSNEAEEHLADSQGDTLFLDDGCVGDFVYQKVGSEWWVNGVLVKEESQLVTVSVSDFGYEWYTEDRGGCERNTSTSREAGVDAERFVEYQATEWARTLTNEDWVE